MPIADITKTRTYPLTTAEVDIFNFIPNEKNVSHLQVLGQNVNYQIDSSACLPLSAVNFVAWTFTNKTDNNIDVYISGVTEQACGSSTQAYLIAVIPAMSRAYCFDNMLPNGAYPFFGNNCRMMLLKSNTNEILYKKKNINSSSGYNVIVVE